MFRTLSLFIIYISSVISISVTSVYAASSLDFELVPLHYGLLNGEPLTKNENVATTDFTLSNRVNKGDKQLRITGNHILHPSELIVYQTTSGIYHVAQVQRVIGNDVFLMNPLKGDINSGNNIWNFYDDSSHPNRKGFRAVGDYALSQLKAENFSNKIHAFIGDSWFDNSTMVPHLTNKLNAAQIINKGVGGRRTIDVLNTFDTEFPPSAAVQPDYFWIVLGTNDYWDETPRETYIDNLKKIIKKVNDLGAKAIVLTSSVAPFVHDANTPIGSNIQTPFYYDLSHHYADDLLALYQEGKGNISAYSYNDNVIIKFTANKPINNNDHYLYFIDTDNNTNTGYQSSSIWEDSGIDFLVQDAYVYNSHSSGWGWDNKKPIELADRNKIILSRNDIGLSNNGANTILRVGVLILSNDWSTVEDYFPKSKNMQLVTLTPPVTQLKAYKDSITTQQGTTITIDVLANDTGTGLNINNHEFPPNGGVHLANNKLIYTPNTGYSGIENFWYEIIDSSGNTARSSVEVTVENYTILKVQNDTATAHSGNDVTIDVLANDTGTGLTIGWYDNPTNGRAHISNNMLIYTPDNGFTGIDSFWYEAVDSSGNTTWGNIKVNVGNNTLKANNDTTTIRLWRTLSIDVLANDTGENLTLIAVDSAWTGNISIKGNKLEYKSDGTFIGNLVVYYGISDANGNTDWANVTIKIIL